VENLPREKTGNKTDGRYSPVAGAKTGGKEPETNEREMAREKTRVHGVVK
jgi:hypothetical protein